MNRCGEFLITCGLIFDLDKQGIICKRLRNEGERVGTASGGVAVISSSLSVGGERSGVGDFEHDAVRDNCSSGCVASG